MEIHISPEMQQRIQRFVDNGVFSSVEGAAESTLKDRLVMEEWLLENKDAVHAAIEEGVASIEKGNFVTLEEAKKRFL